MNVEYINPFLEAGFNIIKSVLVKDAKLGETYITKSPIQKPSSLIIIPMTDKKLMVK